MSSEQLLLGVDAGGTFTDFVLVSIGKTVGVTIHKTPSTPAAPEQAILNGIEALGLNDLALCGRLHIIHGSTVATNAVLEGQLARTVFITNTGFGDLLHLARQTRPQLYALEFAPQPPPVPSELCLETAGRTAADGSEIEPLTDTQLDDLVARVAALAPESVAINLLFSFLDARHEIRIETALRERLPHISVSRSSRVLPEYKEYERGIATWLNAALGPVVSGYLTRLQQRVGNSALQIMQSSGETIAAQSAAESAVNLLLSGPAGGLKAVQFIGQLAGLEKIISFDMGGTSTDVALIAGDITRTNEGVVANYPVGVAMVDMHTIGAGGGSIAFIDSGGMLQVGPRSSGAIPGPACYGHGGTEATVTDANLVLGRLVAESALAGDLKLDREAARRAIARLADAIALTIEDTALGIVAVANEHMAKAIRLISVNRGHDPNEFVLASFGGAGGLHVCALAEAMQMRRAIVPVHGGVLSALGMVVADRGRQFSRTVGVLSANADLAQLEAEFEQLQAAGEAELLGEGLRSEHLQAIRSVDMRYKGQSYTLNVGWDSLSEAVARFHAAHQQRYGYALDNATEIVNLRVQVTAHRAAFVLPEPALPAAAEANDCNKTPDHTVYGHTQPVAVIPRHTLEVGAAVAGPAVITEYAATTYLAAGWNAIVDAYGNLLLEQVNA